MKLTETEHKEFEKYDALYDFSESFRNRVFLITGSNGLLGKSTIKWLLFANEKHHLGLKIYASTRFPERIPDYVEDGDSIVFVKYAEEDLIKQNIDYIIHSAAPTERAIFTNQPVESFRTIVDATERLLDLATGKGSVFLYLSTNEVYGSANEVKPVTEDYVGRINSLNIRNCYPVGKIGAEYLCCAYHHEYGTKIKIIRLCPVQGLIQPYDEGRVFSQILRSIVEKKNFIMKSDGTSKKTVIYTLDAVSAIFTILIKGEVNGVYNAANPDTYMSINDFINVLYDRFAPALKIEYQIEDTSQTGYLPHLSFVQDITKLKRLGWEPITNLTDIYKIDISRFIAQESQK